MNAYIIKELSNAVNQQVKIILLPTIPLFVVAAIFRVVEIIKIV